MTRTSGAAGGMSDSALATRGLAFGTPLARPTGFTYTRSLFPFDFWRDATGRARTNFDRRAWCPTPDVTPWTTPTSYYVDINQAGDSGDGLSWATAKKSISAAITAGNAGSAGYVVNVRAGLYPRAQCPSGSSGAIVPNKACALVAVGGRVETGFFDALGWSLDSGTTYKATRSAARRALNISATDQDGLYQDLFFATDLANCRATPGSWWTDNVTTYVTRADSAAVTDANTRILLSLGASAGVVQMSSGGNMYLSGFDCEGGLPLFLNGSAANRFVGEDSTFRYSSGADGIVSTPAAPYNGVTIQNLLGAAFIRCDASGNQADGFNSHLISGVQAFVFTMDCTGFGNGRQGALSCNFLTTHDGGRWIDLRGIGARNAGGQIAIVNDGTMMWCIDTLAYASRGDQILGGTVPPSDFLVDISAGGSPVKLFLENCAASASQYSLNAKYGSIYIRGGKFPGGRFTSNGGSVSALA